MFKIVCWNTSKMNDQELTKLHLWYTPSLKHFGQKNQTCIIAVLWVLNKNMAFYCYSCVHLFCQKIIYCCLIYMENMFYALSKPMKSKSTVICFNSTPGLFGRLTIISCIINKPLIAFYMQSSILTLLIFWMTQGFVL